MPSMWPRQSKQRVRGVSALARCAWAVVVAGWAGVGACDRPGSGETERPLAAVAMLGGPGISPGLFDTPRAIDTDGSSLWVVDKGTARVQRLITGRRGQVLGYDAKDGWNGWDVVSAQMPQAELHDLIVELRSLTLGVGTFTCRFDHLQELAGRLADQVVQARNAAAAAQ